MSRKHFDPLPPPVTPSFAAPTTDRTRPLAPGSLKSTDTLALAVQCLTAMIVVVSAIATGVEAKLSLDLRRSWEVGFVSEATTRLADLSDFLALGDALMFILNGVLTVVMMKRMVGNGAEMSPRPGNHASHWAVTGWFVPFLNFVRPYQIVRQIWLTSGLKTAQSQLQKTPAVVHLWWACFVALMFAERISSRMESRANSTLLDITNQTTAVAVMHGIQVVSGVLFIFVVRKLSRRHELALDQYR